MMIHKKGVILAAYYQNHSLIMVDHCNHDAIDMFILPLPTIVELVVVSWAYAGAACGDED